jgi:FKBP-type peptidyl-prolyl cis-trans isomerase
MCIKSYAENMKYFMKLFVLAVFLCGPVFWGCNKEKGGSASTPADQIFDKDTSYALGLNVASSMKKSNVNPDLNEFFQGFKDVMKGDKTRFTEEEAETKLQETFTAMMEKANEGLKQVEVDFLAENSKRPGVVITGSGLQYEVLSEGAGARPSATDMVRVNYEGTLTDGTVFDSSYPTGEPVEFPLNGVIPGWTEGLQLMQVGSKFKFYVPSELAYGPQGVGPIPPYSALIFEVELLDILK